MFESLFNKVADLKTFYIIKNWIQHRCFPVNIAKFLRRCRTSENGCFWTCFQWYSEKKLSSISKKIFRKSVRSIDSSFNLSKFRSRFCWNRSCHGGFSGIIWNFLIYTIVEISEWLFWNNLFYVLYFKKMSSDLIDSSKKAKHKFWQFFDIKKRFYEFLVCQTREIPRWKVRQTHGFAQNWCYIVIQWKSTPIFMRQRAPYVKETLNKIYIKYLQWKYGSVKF